MVLFILFLGLILFPKGELYARDAYFYEPGRSAGYQDDPYRTLHLIHYQLYRHPTQPVYYFSYPYPIAQVIIQSRPNGVKSTPTQRR